MAEFINTIEVLGDDVVRDSIIDRTITEFKDNNVTSLGEGSFYGCSFLKEIDCPNVTSFKGTTFQQCSALETIRLPELLSLPGSFDSILFNGCTSLKRLYLPKVSEIITNKLRNLPTLEYVDLTEVQKIGAYAMCGTNLQTLILRNVNQKVELKDITAFSYIDESSGIAQGTGYIYVPGSLVVSYTSATNWSTYADQFRSILEEDTEAMNAIIDGTLVDYENNTIEYIPPFAFNGYQELKSLKSTSLLKIGNKSFYGCSALEEVDLPNVTEIGDAQYPGRSFEGCTSLRSVSLPSLTTLGGRNTFAKCTNLQEISLPNLTTQTGGYDFVDTSIVSIELPKLTRLMNGTFMSCKSLKMVDLHAVTSIQGPFEYCTSLEALIIRTPTICTWEFTWGLPPTVMVDGTGYIYVPKALIEDYKVANNWSTYAAQFRALEDYTVDGTTTGALDETKI